MSDLESAETLQDLQDKVEFDMSVLERMAARCVEQGMPLAGANLDTMHSHLQALRLALIACGIWEDEIN